LDELPIYGRVDRVRVKNIGGPWQETKITVHWKHEIDTPAFREFLKKAAGSYQSLIGPTPAHKKLFRASEMQT
jgi:excinuclease ABC subunit A